ncbi:hypothetical protein NXX20_03735 [Bacteroides stercoris]|nr:hypothetical protein [Bacteroides stercoris]
MPLQKHPYPSTETSSRNCGPDSPHMETVRPAAGNRGSPQLENEVLHPAFLYYTRAKTTKPTGNSRIKTQRLGCSAPENRGF